jgi:hypothetical protein
LLIALLVVVIAGAAGVYLVTRADGATPTESQAPAVGWAAAEHPDEESGGSPCGTGEGIGRRLTGSDDGVVGGCR